MKNALNTNATDRRGAMLPMLAVVMIILMIVVSLGVDIARMHLTRSELRTANDAAARAAVESIGRSQNETTARNAAIAVAARNSVAGKGLTLRSDQIKVGHATKLSSGRYEFQEGGSYLTSARVVGSRSSTSPDGSVGLLFGPLFGVDEFCSDSAAAATQSQRDIALVLDVSGSMASEGRFEALADALESFLSVLNTTPQSEYVSLSVYETTARKSQVLTSNLTSINDAFDDEAPNGATAIGLGMSEGLNSVLYDSNARPFALKTIVVMTDGNHNTDIDPETIAQQCADKNVSVYTITFKDGADEARMEQVAQIAGGLHVHATSNAELEEAFESIARQLGVMLIE
ncbi:vWA domain-containing protein [Mariniblastus fucicola]|uniref:von Willebrand factor type A domain protein n=1 Tax=Mariniblastus fucicola TaxID=980251 RepID=A0A5B9P9C7_9BACT|nr:VWA domain-containing protein [Mariniblastus fucicola]QEG21835.1 von Willebrand factor type A domain protein [Mariniblastus fucicola]